MRIYYYHTIDAKTVHDRWQQGLLPSHLLYGACTLERKGHHVIYHHPVYRAQRWRIALDTLKALWRRRKEYDIVYATTFRGLELIVFLRALRLFPRPIVCWHHQPIVKAKQPLRELVARLFYKGFDELCFFSQSLVDVSLQSVKAPVGHMHVVPWGADLEWYDRLRTENPVGQRHGFVSTGKERRDMPTLVKALAACLQEKLDIYICRESLGINYERLFEQLRPSANVHVHFVQGDVIRSTALKVWQSQGAVICCLPTNYTTGLTTVVEAMALGVPVVCTVNRQMPMDIGKERMGLVVDVGDVSGWSKAITYLSAHPDEAAAFGRNGRRLAETMYNEKQCAAVAETILHKALKGTE